MITAPKKLKITTKMDIDTNRVSKQKQKMVNAGMLFFHAVMLGDDLKHARQRRSRQEGAGEAAQTLV
jgi:hypothetical protein